jgi:hypothetical protein
MPAGILRSLSEKFILNSSASLVPFSGAEGQQQAVGWIMTMALAIAARHPFLDLLTVVIIITPKNIDRV